MSNKVVIYGTATLSRIIFSSSQQNKNIEVVGFTADKEYISNDTFMGKPLLNITETIKRFPPSSHKMLFIHSYKSIRNRAERYLDLKQIGFKMTNYIDPSATISSTTSLGENNIFFEQVHIDAYTKIGDNNIFRPQVYIGHDNIIGNHNYFSPGCNIAGYCSIQDKCFIGIGANITPRTSLAEETLIGASSLILKDTEQHSKYFGVPAKKIAMHKERGIIL